MSEARDGRLADRLAEVLGTALGTPVAVEELTRLPGGASKNTWSFTIRGPAGPRRRLVLRSERSTRDAAKMVLEGNLLEAARRAGVPVPAIVAAGDGSDGVGAPYLVTEFVDGETIPRRILRDERLSGARDEMASQCGRILAAIHRIAPAEVPGLPRGDVVELASQLDALGQPHPAFELALRWLDDHRPSNGGESVVHGDFRNGNLIVGEDGVRAVLDWELAHLGDPLEDLAWLCAKAWRFGSPLPVGGFGTVGQLVEAYEGAGGSPVAREALDWWIVHGTLRWGVICIAQAMTHLSGAVRSVELAAIGRRVCEVESDLLELLPWGSAPPPQAAATAPPPSRAPHDIPSAGQLLEAVHDFLAADAAAATSGRVRFHLRVAANVVAMVGREIELGEAQTAAHATRLRELGVDSETALAAGIRAGAFDGRLDEVGSAVRATVADKLRVANPAYGTLPAG